MYGIMKSKYIYVLNNSTNIQKIYIQSLLGITVHRSFDKFVGCHVDNDQRLVINTLVTQSQTSTWLSHLKWLLYEHIGWAIDLSSKTIHNIIARR